MVKVKHTILLFCLLLSSQLMSCSTKISDYEVSSAEQPNAKEDSNFDIKEYFTGNIVAWGMLEDYNNKVTRRFCVEIEGTWNDNEGVLAEKFYFDDGEINYRNWRLTKLDNGDYQGTAEDVIGTAIGKHSAFAFQLEYTLLLEVGGKSYQVSMDDWMYQIDEYRVMNKTSISKMGINLANVTLFFDKKLPSNTCS